MGCVHRLSIWFDRLSICFLCVCMKRVEENRNEYVRNMSEMVEDEEEDEEEDVAALSSLDSYQLCQKYQQVMRSPQQSVSFCRGESALMLCSFTLLMVLLSFQLQLKLRSAASQLQQARGKVGQPAVLELSCYLCIHIRTCLTHLPVLRVERD